VTTELYLWGGQPEYFRTLTLFGVSTFLCRLSEPCLFCRSAKRSYASSADDAAATKNVPAPSLPHTPTSMPTPAEQIAISRALKQLYGANATLSSTAHVHAMHVVLDGTRDVLAVLPTGSGKSALVHVPALLQPDRVSVVVAPYRALLWQYEDELKAHRIFYSTWPESNLGTVLLVSVQDLADPALAAHLATLHARGSLARIVLDEVHVVLNDDDFRHSVIAPLARLRRVPVPLLLLTATLPVADEVMLLKALLANPVVYRLPSVRNNAKVCVLGTCEFENWS
jgi:superfamily II DNA helicase RecQ